MIALGDSYSIGEGVAAHERWPAVLADALSGRGVHIEAPQYVARTGWTTTDLLAELSRRPPAPAPHDLVSLLIGVNNQFAGLGLDLYRADFTTLLDAAIALAGGRPRRVLVLSIPDYGVTPGGSVFGAERIRDEISAYNALNRSIAQARHTLYADITPLSRRAGDEPDLLAPDGLHVSGKMYALWVDHLIDGVGIAAHLTNPGQ